MSPSGRRVLVRRSVIDEIIAEAALPNSDTNHPLPLFSTWTTGSIFDNFTTPTTHCPTWFMQQIAAGHHVLPTFESPANPTMLAPSFSGSGSLNWTDYYQTAIQTCAAVGLPICFIGTQWEQRLYQDTTWFAASYANNPNMWVSGAAVSRVSAFGATAPWTAMGQWWTNPLNLDGGSSMLSAIQGWYPSPPRVFWVGNNEAATEHPTTAYGGSSDVDVDQHYLDSYASGASDALKRQRLNAGWAIRYPLMFAGMKSNMTTAWSNASKFIGYEAFGPRNLGTAAWRTFSLYETNKMSPWPQIWDGGSPSYYLGANAQYDDWVQSPQYVTCNYPFQIAEAHTLNPNFWFELSTWDIIGEYPLPTVPTGNAEWDAAITHAPAYTPDRYAGMSRFGAWMTQPRVMRQFMDSPGYITPQAPFVAKQMEVVDEVYSNATLRTFWRQSTLVNNGARSHLFNTDIPAEYASAERSFLLTTSLDIHGGDSSLWGVTETMLVYVLARVRGTTPNRQWLVLGYAPNGTQTPDVTLPGYGTLTAMSCTVAGKFWLVSENGSTVTAVN